MSAGPEEISIALARLRVGGLVAFPTETVYGLGADARSADAVRRVFAVKGRPSTNPLIVHVSGEEMARKVAGAWPREASALARAFWPGPLSIIVPRGAGIPGEVTAGGPTMAVRCPEHPITLALLEAFGGPLVGPSANPSGRISPTRAEHVREAFSEEDVYVLDGGPCTGGIESTVVSVVGGGEGGVRVLRPGLIGADAIAKALGVASVVMEAKRAGGETAMESPGQLLSHYAPRTAAHLFAKERWAEVAARAERSRVVVVSPRGRTLAKGVHSTVIAMPADAAGYAARLYEALREADAVGAEAIYVEDPLEAGDDGWRTLGAAVMDRLTRATTPM